MRDQVTRQIKEQPAAISGEVVDDAAQRFALLELGK